MPLLGEMTYFAHQTDGDSLSITVLRCKCWLHLNNITLHDSYYCSYCPTEEDTFMQMGKFGDGGRVTINIEK